MGVPQRGGELPDQGAPAGRPLFVWGGLCLLRHEPGVGPDQSWTAREAAAARAREADACAARLRARRRSRSRSTSTASASSLCTLRPARSSTSTAPPARPAPPRPAPPRPAPPLRRARAGRARGAPQAPRLAHVAIKGELHPHQPTVAVYVLLSCFELRSARRRVARQGHPCGGRLEQPHDRGGHGPQPARVHGRLGRRVPQRRHRAERGARAGPRRAARDPRRRAPVLCAAPVFLAACDGGLSLPVFARCGRARPHMRCAHGVSAACA